MRLARILVGKLEFDDMSTSSDSDDESTSSDSDDKLTSPGEIVASVVGVEEIPNFSYLRFDIRSRMRELLSSFMMVVKFFCREKETL